MCSSDLNTERIMANAAAKLPKETCKKLGESLELYQKLTVSTAVYTHTQLLVLVCT